MADLDTDVRYIKGVGEVRAKALAKLGVKTLRDLVSYFPRAYEDRLTVKPITSLIAGESVCVAAVVASKPTLSHVRKGMDIVKLRVVDAFGTMNVTFFNQNYVRESLSVGESYVFFGRVGGTAQRPEMTNPVFEKEENMGAKTGRIMPVYRLTAGVRQGLLIKAVSDGLEACGDILPDPLPRGVQQKHQLAQSRFAYENIHFPKDYESLDIARRRMIFEEFFVLSCAMAMMRKKRTGESGNRLPPADMEEFYSKLPFTPTGAQRRAVSEAEKDMTGGVPMSRLVQGDVGSGKTMVAAACCWHVCREGFQAAVMAPTEILAEQHLTTFTSFLEPFGMRVAILKGGMTAKSRRETLEKLKNREIDVIVGTHALISDTVEFDSLALVVTDEQHRFGVQQRAALTGKGKSPHVLVMSATPIPRTLALIMYGELDVSVIDELPPGRQKTDTFAVGEEMRPRIYEFIRKNVSRGRQAYIVCPMVEETETGGSGLKSVVEYAKKLQEKVFPELKVGLVHGKMRPKEKESVMRGFVSGATDILVATTVIEVGVDVPNAVLMVVENADRFGLSQLHQLRGRVGRGSDKSYCILFEGAGGEVSKKRLEILCGTNDGFKVSEADLRLRGPGDFFGSRQHGLPEMKIVDFASDMRILKSAQTAAEEVIAGDRSLRKPENQALRGYINRMMEEKSVTFN